MRFVLALGAFLVPFAPLVALACPYGSAPEGCDGCGSSTLFSVAGYGLWLLLGLGVGFASVGECRPSRR
jgi:hypothetical protein